LMGTASQKAVSHYAHFAGNGHSLHKKCNNVDDRFLARPKGATQSVQYGVMGLAKGITIACDPCLVLNALDCSVPINTMLLEY